MKSIDEGMFVLAKRFPFSVQGVTSFCFQNVRFANSRAVPSGEDKDLWRLTPKPISSQILR